MGQGHLDQGNSSTDRPQPDSFKFRLQCNHYTANGLIANGLIACNEVTLRSRVGLPLTCSNGSRLAQKHLTAGRDSDHYHQVRLATGSPDDPEMHATEVVTEQGPRLAHQRLAYADRVQVG